MTEEIKTTEEVMPTQETTSEQAIAPVVPVAQVSEATVATGNVAVAQENKREKRSHDHVALQHSALNRINVNFDRMSPRLLLALRERTASQ